MKILIAGGSGFIGGNLSWYFCENGAQVYVLTRNPNNTQKTNSSITFITELTKDEMGYDVIINLSGEPLDRNRWNDGVKKTIYESRMRSTQKIIDYIEATSSKPKLLINASAIGFYGHHESEIFNEDSLPQNDGFTETLCRDWENTAQQASKFGVRVCLLRTGIVLDKNGGALKKMLPPFKFGLGAQLGDGEQWMSWIHMEDVIGAIHFLIQKDDLTGPFNLTSPFPLTNKEFTQRLAEALHRPWFLTLPDFFVKMLFGEMGETLLLRGQKVLPDKLINSGYHFKFPKLSDALSDILK